MRQTKIVERDQATDTLEKQPSGKWKVVKTTYKMNLGRGVGNTAWLSEAK